MINNIFLIAFGGAFGAIFRYLISRFIDNFSNNLFSFGTLSVNFIGSLLVGFLIGFLGRNILSESVNNFTLIGFLGAFTTFSAFTMQSVVLWQENEFRLFFTNILTNNILGIAAVFIGLFLFKIFTKNLS